MSVTSLRTCTLPDRQITLHRPTKNCHNDYTAAPFRNTDYLLNVGLDYCADLCGLGTFSKASAHHAVARASHMPREKSFQSIWDDVIRRRFASSGSYLLSSEWFSGKCERCAPWWMNGTCPSRDDCLSLPDLSSRSFARIGCKV